MELKFLNIVIGAVDVTWDLMWGAVWTWDVWRGTCWILCAGPVLDLTGEIAGTLDMDGLTADLWKKNMEAKYHNTMLIPPSPLTFAAPPLGQIFAPPNFLRTPPHLLGALRPLPQLRIHMSQHVHRFTYPKGKHSYRDFLPSNSFVICSCILPENCKRML